MTNTSESKQSRPTLRPGDYSACPTRQILGITLYAISTDDSIELCTRAIENRERLRIGVVNAAKIINMRQSRELRDAVTQSDIVLADGMSVVWASRLLSSPLPERVNGTNLFEELLKLANNKNYRVYLLGARQETLEELCHRIEKWHPELQIAGARNGYFNDRDAPGVAKEIYQSRADMLFVGITSPKKEIFMAKYGDVLDVPVIHGVGGSFDVLAGLVKRAPISWQKSGFEWLYRIIQEPRRMWKRYLITNTKFVLMVLRAMLSRPNDANK